MKDKTYRLALKKAEQELFELLQSRDLLERHIAQTRQTVATLRTKVDGDVAAGRTAAFIPRTLTDACRWILQAAPQPLDAPTIRINVEASGFDIRSSNPLASVHSVLKRLIQQGEVRNAYRTDKDGRLLFWSRAFWYGDPGAIPKPWVTRTPDEVAVEHAEHLARLAKDNPPEAARRYKPGEPMFRVKDLDEVIGLPQKKRKR